MGPEKPEENVADEVDKEILECEGVADIVVDDHGEAVDAVRDSRDSESGLVMVRISRGCTCEVVLKD